MSKKNKKKKNSYEKFMKEHQKETGKPFFKKIAECPAELVAYKSLMLTTWSLICWGENVNPTDLFLICMQTYLDSCGNLDVDEKDIFDAMDEGFHLLSNHPEYIKDLMTTKINTSTENEQVDLQNFPFGEEV